MGLESDIKADVDAVEVWRGVEEKKVVSVLKPIIQDVIAAGKQDLLQDIIADTPAAVAAEITGGPAAAIGVTATALGVQLDAQVKALAQTILTAVASAVVASAQAAASTGTATATPAQASWCAAGISSIGSRDSSRFLGLKSFRKSRSCSFKSISRSFSSTRSI